MIGDVWNAPIVNTKTPMEKVTSYIFAEGTEQQSRN